MSTKPLPSQEFLSACFDYDPVSGVLTWKRRSAATFVGTEKRSAEHQAANFNARFVGRPALASPAKNGYLRGTINGSFFYAQRVIWKIIYGKDPVDVDHENGDRQDNRLSNLRDVCRTDNLKNRQLSKNNSSGFHGVTYSRRHQLWSATIYHNNHPVHLGWFKNKADAIVARKEAEIRFNYHANHGRAA